MIHSVKHQKFNLCLHFALAESEERVAEVRIQTSTFIGQLVWEAFFFFFFPARFRDSSIPGQICNCTLYFCNQSHDLALGWNLGLMSCRRDNLCIVSANRTGQMVLQYQKFSILNLSPLHAQWIFCWLNECECIFRIFINLYRFRVWPLIHHLLKICKNLLNDNYILEIILLDTFYPLKIWRIKLEILLLINPN